MLQLLPQIGRDVFNAIHLFWSGVIDCMKQMKKITLVGSPGAGKSTLARELGKRLNIEVIHLDRFFWQAGWEAPFTKEVWEEFQRYLISLDQWIIDGTYLSTSEIRLAASDTIIFLDRSPFLCLYRVIRRHFKRRHLEKVKQPPPDFADASPDRLNPQYLKKVFWDFPRRDRKDLLNKIQIIQEQRLGGTDKLITHRSNREISAFLQSLPEQSSRKQERSSSECQEIITEQALELLSPAQESVHQERALAGGLS